MIFFFRVNECVMSFHQSSVESHPVCTNACMRSGKHTHAHITSGKAPGTLGLFPFIVTCCPTPSRSPQRHVCVCVCGCVWGSQSVFELRCYPCEAGVPPRQVYVCPVGRVAGQGLFIEQIRERERGRERV